MLPKETILLNINKCLDTKLSNRLYLNYSDNSFFNFYLEFFYVKDLVHIYLNSDNCSEHFLLEVKDSDSFLLKDLKKSIETYIEDLKKDLNWYKIIK